MFPCTDRPWQWCIEVPVLSVSLTSMQRPGGEQMARPRSPPAGRCRHRWYLFCGRRRLATWASFLPLAVQPYFTANKTGLLTVTYCPGTKTNAINKRKECAMSSANTDTLCISGNVPNPFTMTSLVLSSLGLFFYCVVCTWIIHLQMFYGFVLPDLSLQSTRCLCTVQCSFRGFFQILFRPHFPKHSKTLQKHQCERLEHGLGQVIKMYYLLELIHCLQVCESCTQVSKIIIYSLNDIIYIQHRLNITFISSL